MATVATLALGVGLNTAIFSLIEQAILQPLPYSRSGRLVGVTETRDGEERSTAWLDFLDWRKANHSFTDLAAFWRRNLVIAGDGDAEQVRGLAVTSNLFRTLGARPLIGHTFSASSDGPDPAREVVLTYALWQTRYGRDPGIVGRAIRLDGEPYTVIGVMRRGFRFPDGIFLGRSHLYVPAGLSVGNEAWNDRDDHPGIYAIGRLANGVTISEARRDLSAIAATLRKTYPKTNEHTGVMVIRALDEVVGDLPSTLTMLFLGVAAVLLIAVANVSGLAAARAIGRGHEVAVRSALGAHRGRIVRMLLAESVLVGGLSFCVAIVLARLAIHLSAPLMKDLPRLEQVSIHPGTMLFGFAIAIGASLLAGIGPSIRVSGRSAAAALHARGSVGGSRSPLRSGLAVLQIGLALVLVTTSLLLARTLLALRADHGGIRPEGVLTFKVDLPRSSFDEDASRAFQSRLLQRLRNLPGVEAAGGISTLPFSGSGRQSGFTRDDEADAEPAQTDIAVVSGSYFRAMGVDLLKGRTFRASDDASSPIVAVADERFAKRFWPGKDPIGRKVRGWGFHHVTIVGVVRHVKNYGVQADSRPELYFAYDQRPFHLMYGIVASRGRLEGFGPKVRSVMKDLDPGVPVGTTVSMADVVADTRSTSELAALFGVALSALATLLSATGLYSLLAHEILERRREIGIRMALGATRRSILRLMGRRSFRVVALGSAAGLVSAWWLTRLIETFLFKVNAHDPKVFAGALGAMSIVVAAASVIPLIRASRSDPATILREPS